MTFVRTRLALEALAPGQRLDVWLRGAEPRESVPAGLRRLGHEVVAETAGSGEDEWILTLRRGPQAQGSK